MESLNTPELQRLALIIGAMVAVNYKNTYGIWTRQKMGLVCRGMLISTLISAAILGLIYLIGSNGLGLEFNTIEDMIRGKRSLALQYPLLQFYAMLGVGYWIYRRVDIRSGGYIIAPAAAALLVNPISAVLFLVGCISNSRIHKVQ